MKKTVWRGPDLVRRLLQGAALWAALNPAPGSAQEQLQDLTPYGIFRPTTSGVISAEELADDYAALARESAARPDATYHVRYEEGGAIHYGVLRGTTIHRLDTHFFADPRPTGETTSIDRVRLLAPLDPNRVSKVLGPALNTRSASLSEVDPESHPRWFAKLPTSIIGPGDGVEHPPEATFLNNEAEIAFIIGKEARHVSVEEAPAYIFGIAAGNDLSENRWYTEANQRAEPTRTIGKVTNTWSALGPAIATGLDYSQLTITHRLNGEVTQEWTADQYLQSPAELISYLSRYVTLLPGDVIFPGTAGWLRGARRAIRAGDELEVEVEGLGILRNRVIPMEGAPWEERW